MKLLSNGRDWIPNDHLLSSKKTFSIRIGLHLTKLLRKQHGNPQTTQDVSYTTGCSPQIVSKATSLKTSAQLTENGEGKTGPIQNFRHHNLVFGILQGNKEENLKVSITRWNIDSNLALFRFRGKRKYFILTVQVIVFHIGQSLWNGPFSCLASVNALTSTDHRNLWSLPVLTQFCMESNATPHCSQDLCGLSLQSCGINHLYTS